MNSPSYPYLHTAVSSTPILVLAKSTAITSVEAQNINTSDVWLQLFDTNVAANVKINVTYTVVFGTGVFTSTSHGMSNGWRLRVMNTGGAVPAGLSANTDYYVINAATNTFGLSASSGGTAVTLTDNGTGTNSFTTFIVHSYIIPASDGSNTTATAKDWSDRGLKFNDGIVMAITTTATGSTAPTTACVVNMDYL